MKTGRKILNLRKDRGVAQKVLASLTSVTASALSRIEAGQHQPRGPVALRIARHLGVTVDYLLDEEAPYPPPASAILSNILPAAETDEDRGIDMRVSAREQRILEALRSLEEERWILLEAALDAPRDEVRRLIHDLGAQERLSPEDPSRN